MKSMPAPSQTAAAIAACNTQFLSRQSTKVLIQDIATHRYLSSTNRWTTKVEEAMTFRSGSTAVEHLNQARLSKVQLILTRDITVHEVIPVTDLLRS